MNHQTQPLTRRQPLKIQTVGVENQRRNRAFARASNRRSGALKNHQKILFIQQLAETDFALGASRLSWHK
jgi:hypothetical protein